MGRTEVDTTGQAIGEGIVTSLDGSWLVIEGDFTPGDALTLRPGVRVALFDVAGIDDVADNRVESCEGCDDAHDEISRLEGKLRAARTTIAERGNRITALEKQVERLQADLDAQTNLAAAGADATQTGCGTNNNEQTNEE
ncbi:hypothetical protein [Mycolicibacterium fortuitum]|uniref:hypothetical protein n=1 Tax=Mycolicibacterium fortuitum TaxID=1766 RepID=UPI00263655F1|nr:hypothetical protein [Mycolicibacterium fortuitum]